MNSEMDCDALCVFLMQGGLKQSIVDRLKSEAFDGSTFIAATPSLLLALGFKGAEIAAIQVLQSASAVSVDGAKQVNVEPRNEQSSGPQRRSLRSNSNLTNPPSPAQTGHGNRTPISTPKAAAAVAQKSPQILHSGSQGNMPSPQSTPRRRAVIQTAATPIRCRVNTNLQSSGVDSGASSNPLRPEDYPSSSSGSQSTGLRFNESLGRSSLSNTAVSTPQTSSGCFSGASENLRSTPRTFQSPSFFRTFPQSGTGLVNSIPGSNCSQSTSSLLNVSVEGNNRPSPVAQIASGSQAQAAVNLGPTNSSTATTAPALSQRCANPSIEAVISASLPQFDVLKILTEELPNKKINTDMISKLRNNMVLPVKDRKFVIRTLAHFLHMKHVSDPKDVTTQMKEGLARSFVMAVPIYQNISQDENIKPWHHVYHPKSSGWLANASRPFQRKHRKRKSKKSEDEDSEVDVTETEAIEKLAELMPGRAEKAAILDGMAATFKTRNMERRNSVSIKDMLEKYPHFKNYDGEVMKEEFKRLQPNAQEFCSQFSKLLPKILNLPERRREIVLTYEDDALKALMRLSQQLAHDIPQKSDGDVTHSWAIEEDLVNVIQPNQDIVEYIATKRINAKKPVQPYLLLVRSPVTQRILRTFLVLDDFGVQLPSTTFLKAFDWLFKSFFVFNVKYPFGWRNTFHFLQICFYKITENIGKKDMMNASEFELWHSLSQT